MEFALRTVSDKLGGTANETFAPARVRGFLYIENPTLDVGFQKAYSYKEVGKAPFDRMSCGLPTATKISKGGHPI